MRKIRIIVHVSLDGVFQPAATPGEGGDDYANGGWTVPYRTPDGRQAVLEAHGSSFDLLLGRLTYELFAGFWPKAGNIPIANAINAATKYVATHRPGSLGWGPARGLGPDVVTGVREMRSKDGPDLVVLGSASLASVLLAEGLVDEVLLLVYPVLLGRGRRFFPEGAETRKLALVGTKTTSSGVLMNTYRPVA
ncbi:MAG TPA: dihydrofolate reductase family protein [Opitutaceae bacterium]|jgi:dihydrofolate reductase